MTDDDWFTNGALGSVWAVYWLLIAWKGCWDLARTLGVRCLLVFNMVESKKLFNRCLVGVLTLTLPLFPGCARDHMIDRRGALPVFVEVVTRTTLLFFISPWVLWKGRSSRGSSYLLRCRLARLHFGRFVHWPAFPRKKKPIAVA